MSNKKDNDIGGDGVPTDSASADPALKASGLMACGPDSLVAVESKMAMSRVQFVDIPSEPRGRGRLDLSTGDRH